jgi:uncharacterized protein
MVEDAPAPRPADGEPRGATEGNRLSSRLLLGQRRSAPRARVGAVKEPLFSVPVRDLERSDQRRSWEVPPAWLDSALAESEARSDGTPGTLELYLKKQGREILVKGQVRAKVQMPCARTLEPVPVALDAEILLLLTPSTPGPAGTPRPGRRQRPPKVDPEADAVEVPVEEKSAEVLSAEEAARDEYSGDYLQLDPFVREHLLLELPLFPVRSDLPFEANAATDTPPDDSGAAPDPRLAPLAALAIQLQKTGKLPKSSKE